MSYRAPLKEYHFILNEVVDFPKIAATPRFEAAGPEMVEAILAEAAKLAEQTLAPLNRVGDTHPARLEDGVVRCSPGFAEGFRAIGEGGWIGMSASVEVGGLGLPMSLTTCVNEMIGSACLALQLNPLMTQGQIEALEHHASEAIKALYIPKLISGEWSGTMNLTEPEAGSDVGALRSRAEAQDDGSYAISGQKIFISWGDSDLAANICHLVLARLPGGGEGTKGISLFIVPKFLPDAQGQPGECNAAHPISLEHKMGLHGSPTAIMQFDRAKGWLVGEAHRGMAAMFTMMNNARLGVGVQGISAAEGAYQLALAYASGRKQGATLLVGGTAGKGAIIEHADVRRMLGLMKAQIFAARAIALACAGALDMAKATGDAGLAARAALLTPITKAFGTDTGCEVADLGIQVHGGMGYIEATGAAQYLRDVRVTAIYEGTNGIQALDLVGRKMQDGGAAAFGLMDEIQSGAEAARGLYPDLAQEVWTAAAALRAATQALIGQSPYDRGAAAVPYLRGFALVLSGHFHLKAACADPPRLALARLAIRRLMPLHAPLLAQVQEGAESLFALTPEALGA
jgi:acyl-CoA dehydrogenase